MTKAMAGDDEVTVDVTLEPGDEIFTHSAEGTFNISALHRVLAEASPVWALPQSLPISPDLVAHCRNNDPAPGRIEAVKWDQARFDAPVLVMVRFESAETVHMHVLDGTHRILARAELGRRAVMAIPIPHDFAQHFRIDNLDVPGLHIVARDRETGLPIDCRPKAKN